MSDIIELLPDSVANQIAAGEVIQRPASVVKELLENSIDAGAEEITLIIKDAGKTLIQVIDNGRGMTNADARMAFERHATSKIRNADDLFSLSTKGFRGEALASIASISHVTLKTKPTESELGTELIIEGSKVVSQDPAQASSGSSFAVKNLFYNVPARRNFLKSDQVEMRHITDEFIRVALPHPDIEFKLVHNNEEVYALPKGNLRQRIVGVFGKKFDERIVPIEEETTIVNMFGFIGKPEYCKRSRGEQFFFVNGRFIKSNYLNHAINQAYSELISKDQFPTYFIFLDVDPSSIDVNIHPTKTEVKFEEERAIYSLLQSTVRNSLGKFNIAPSIDFEQESSFSAYIDPNTPVKQPEVKVDPTYNPFKSGGASQGSSPSHKPSSIEKNWESLYEINVNDFERESSKSRHLQQEINGIEERPAYSTIQVNEKYLLAEHEGGFILIDQYRAHVRILYDNFSKRVDGSGGNSQKLLFPEEVQISDADFKHLNAIEHELHQVGFEFEKGDGKLIITGKPNTLDECDVQQLIEQLLESFKINVAGDEMSPKESICRSLAASGAIRKGRKLSSLERSELVRELMESTNPRYAPNGKPVIINFTKEQIEKMFI